MAFPADSRTGIAAFLTAFFIFFSIQAADAARMNPAVQRFLGKAGSAEEISVLVGFHGPSAKESVKGLSGRGDRGLIIEALKDSAGLAQRRAFGLASARGARRVRSLWIVNELAVTATALVIRELASLPEVDGIRIDSAFKAPVMTAAPQSPPEWNLLAVQAPALWEMGFTGQGVVIGSLDTGVDAEHQDIKDKWRGGANSWFDPYDEHPAPFDANGHGTATMGILVGGDAGGTAIGTAPDARWIAAKIFDDAGGATLSALHLSFQWMLDPDGNTLTDDAPHVVNASWGLDNAGSCITEFEADIGVLKAAGIAIFFAAGNSGPNPSTSVSPANNLSAFALGAVDESLAAASFSSRGPSACDGSVFPELAAPGVNVKTAGLTSGGAFPDAYVFVSGTSFSTPHATGVAALLLGARPGLTVAQLEDALKDAALDLGTPGPDNDYGYGLLNAVASGVLNRPPEAPVLVYPNDGQAGLPTTVTFRWKRSSDPDGDTVTYELLVCPSADFSGCSPVKVAANGKGASATMFAALFLIGGVAVAGAGRRRRLATCAVLLALFAFSCGGDDGASFAIPPDEAGYTATGLAANTTYYWKVSALDSNGGRAESATRSFSTE
jgi:bacillopeptidase F